MGIDIDHLKTFIEVNRTKHFGKAAEHLFISQSTVSARIQHLENIVGAPLFTRARNDIQLTPSGLRLLRYAESIVTTWHRARQEITIGEDGRVPLLIAGLPSLWDIFLQDWLHMLWRSNSDLAIYTEALPIEMMTRKLLDGMLDLAFVFEAQQLSSLCIREIARVPLVMVSSEPGKSCQEAVQSAYVLVDWGTSFSIEHAQHFPGIQPPLLHMALGRTARDFIMACGGSAYLAQPMIRDALQKQALFLVADAPVIVRSAHAVYSMDNPKRKLLEQVLAGFSA